MDLLQLVLRGTVTAHSGTRDEVDDQHDEEELENDAEPGPIRHSCADWPQLSEWTNQPL